ALFSPPNALANEGALTPAPRTTIQMDDVSIVLIAANDHLYAFVDRVDDNAPVINAELDINSADGTALEMTRTSEGLFVAPFNRARYMHDACMALFRSPDATAQARAEVGCDS